MGSVGRLGPKQLHLLLHQLLCAESEEMSGRVEMEEVCAGVGRSANARLRDVDVKRITNEFWTLVRLAIVESDRERYQRLLVTTTQQHAIDIHIGRSP